ncbi:MAG: septum site-determining protein MinD [Anaerovoracaceae bacterium]|nr:septum site-determining protein MinD [Anaerovoracaceae bacterium]
MGKVIVVASGKGGTGKTTVVANLGATLAMEGQRTLVVDMDMGLRNLDLYLGLESNVVYDVSDVMNGVCRIKQALIKDKSFPGLYLMAASPKRADGEITPLHMKVLCEKLRGQFDYIIVDGPAGIDDGLAVASAGADMAVVVVSPDYAAARDGEMVRLVLKEMGIERVGFVVNKLNMEMIRKGFAPDVSEIVRGFQRELLGVIQYDENISISTNLGVPVVFMRETYIADNFRKISRRIAEY